MENANLLPDMLHHVWKRRWGYVSKILGDRSIIVFLSSQAGISMTWPVSWEACLLSISKVGLCLPSLPAVGSQETALDSSKCSQGARPYSHFYCSSSVCVSAPKPLFPKSSRTLAVGSRIYFDCSVCKAHKYELQTLGMVSKLKFTATSLYVHCSSTFSHLWPKNSEFHFLMPSLYFISQLNMSGVLVVTKYLPKTWQDNF